MTKQTLRNTIINLLDDENGISSAAYEGVNELLCENDWTDIVDAVEAGNDRYFLGEDVADELRKVSVD